MTDGYKQNPSKFQAKVDEYSNAFKSESTALLRLLKEIIIDCRTKGSCIYDTNDVDTAITGLSLLGGGMMCENFITACHPGTTSEVWNYIYAKDDNYFVNNLGTIFPRLPASVVSKFQAVYQHVDNETKQLVWSYIQSLVCCAIYYLHYRRYPARNTAGNKCYVLSTYLSNVNIVNIYQTWKNRVNLPFD